MVAAGDKIRAVDIPDLTYPIAHVVATVNEAGNSGTITTPETVVSSITFNAVAGATYSLEFTIKAVQSVLADRFLFGVREDTVAGASIDAVMHIPPPAVGSGFMAVYKWLWIAAATGSKTIVGTLVRSSGTGNIIRSSKSSYIVTRVS
jgi:hypothetical protein